LARDLAAIVDSANAYQTQLRIRLQHDLGQVSYLPALPNVDIGTRKRNAEDGAFIVD
jgi:hypothetical protein